MAAIDKIYVRHYKDYITFLNWAKHKIYKCPNGMLIKVYDYCYTSWTEENFLETARPIANTPIALDYFLIKDCPFNFIQDNLRYMYDDEYYNSIKNNTSDYDNFSKNGKIGTKVILKRIGKYSYKDYIWPRKINNKKYWNCVTIQITNSTDLTFNDKLSIWLWPNELGIANTDTAYTSNSIKSAIRHLIKWKLPIGTKGCLKGNYQGEYWEFIIK